MPKPATSPSPWATGGSAEISTPPAATISNGWIAGLKPPHEWWNWFWNLAGGWLVWLESALPVFDTLEDAVDEVGAGDLCIVHENDREFLPGSASIDGGTAATNVVDVVCTGDGVIYAHPGVPLNLVDRDDLVTVVRTFTQTGAGALARLCTDGIRIYAAYGNFVEAWTIATGVSAWTYDHGATVRDICVYGGRLFLVGALGTGNAHVRGLNAETGAAQWSYRHSAAQVLWSCVAVNGRVIVAGEASTYGSAATMRALYYANGNDLANEGGTAADTTGHAWDVVLPNPIGAARMLATDTRRLFVADDTANAVYLCGIADGDIEHTKALAAHTFWALAADQDYVFLCATDGGAAGNCIAFDSATLAMAWRNPQAGDDVAAVATDGGAVFIGLQGSAGDPLIRLRRGNRASVWRKPVIGGGGSEVFQVNPRVINPE